MAGYELAPEALSDLQSIWDFIAADSPVAADRLVEDFFEAFEQLASWPGMGHRRTDLTNRAVRFWPVRTYLVVYREHPEGVQIAAVLHSSRDIPLLLENR
jgi:toxin ParE1/3/4